MTIQEFITKESLNGFRTDDFEYEMKETFNVLAIYSEGNTRYVKIEYKNGKHNEFHTLVYSRSVFTGSIPYYYTLTEIR